MQPIVHYICGAFLSLLTSESAIYELWLKDSLLIKPSIDNKLEYIPDVIQFFWKMKGLLKATTSIIIQLKKEHDSAFIKNRFTADKLESLSPIVNPSISKLIKEEDKAGMAKLGPIYKY